MALHLPIGTLKTRFRLEPVPRCEPSTHMGYSFLLTARVLLYAPSHRQISTYHSLCYTSRGALAGTRNSSVKIRFSNVGVMFEVTMVIVGVTKDGE